MKSNSQASQDIFVREITRHKHNGTFLEIGSNHPITHNNTYILESEYGYEGIMVEYDKSFEQSYTTYRPNSVHILGDAQTTDYKTILETHQFPQNIDYLQVDLDVDNKSTINTLELLNTTVLPYYKFATVTFEHDIYRGNYFNTRELSRKIFNDNGYILVFPDVSLFWEGSYKEFEDWYVHPDLVSSDIINKIKSDVSLSHEEIAAILQTI
jgi:hypothetical protein